MLGSFFTLSFVLFTLLTKIIIMFKNFTLLSFCMLFTMMSFAQTTATGDFSLKTQEQVDAFLTQYPNVTNVEGNLLIGINSQGPNPSVSNITDLSGFSSLKEVTHDLMLAAIPTISNLDFLSNLETVNGYLFIDDDSSLVDITALSHLTTLGSGLAICMNENLTDLTGVQQFTTINGDLYIFGNKELTSYEQLSNIQSIKGSLYIYENPKITDLSGLQNLTNVDGHIDILNNPLLSNCTTEYFCNNISSSKIIIHNNATGCNTKTEIEEACVLGIDQLDGLSFALSPNPASDYLVLDPGFQIKQVTILDMTGQRHTLVANNNQIDISTLPSGIYFAQINDGKQWLTSRFVIE